MSKKRVVFTFDQNSYSNLESVKDTGNFPSLAEAVRTSLNINKVLQNQFEQGYSEVVVRNPKTKEEKILVIPSIERVING